MMRVMTKPALIELLDELRMLASGIPEVTVRFSDRGLDLALDLLQGFDGYECVTMGEEGEHWSVRSVGIADVALGTFLGTDWAVDSEAMVLWARMRQQLLGSQKHSGLNTYNQVTSERYTLLLDMTEHTADYRKATKMMRLVMDVFSRKARH